MSTQATHLMDVYKTFHPSAYHPDVSEVYANFTNRFGKYAPNNKLNGVVNIGAQMFIKKILIKKFNKFFAAPKKEAMKKHFRIINAILGTKQDESRYEALHDLGYLPLEVKQVPEGLIVPYGCPSITVRSTLPGFQWLTNSIETVMSSEIWLTQTSCTTACNYMLNFMKAAEQSGIDKEYIKFQGHDFSYRGMPGTEAASMSGFGHLASGLVGTDTIPAVVFAEDYYNANVDNELVGCSVNATEHSVTCSWQKEGELAFYRYLMHEVAPTGILSIVYDTWDFWGSLATNLIILKDEILARDGQIVIRPDSGDPVEVLCGKQSQYYDAETLKEAFDRLDDFFREELDDDPTNPFYSMSKLFKIGDKHYEITYSPDLNRHDKTYYYIDNMNSLAHYMKYEEIQFTEEERIENIGLMEHLINVFGYTEIKGSDGKMYKHLNPKIGAIYGDSITIERQLEIQKRLMEKGIAPTMVLGIGSFTYQYVTRDTHGSAVKATSVIKAGERDAIFKAPKTDMSKKSAKGLMKVWIEDGEVKFKDDVTEQEEREGILETCFIDGELIKETSLEEIRSLVKSQLETYM